MNIIFLGLRGSGKSTVGQLLGRRLGRALTDLDLVTLSLLGCATVKEAWVRGEDVFRRAEANALEQALAQSGRIIALGGGTPTAPGAAEMLREAQAARRAILFYLAADADTLRSRLQGEGAADRPALLGDDPLMEIEAVRAARDPLYRELADHVVDASRAVAEVSEDVLRLIQP